MDGDFGDDVGVEAVAEIDGVDVVAVSAQHRLALGKRGRLAGSLEVCAAGTRGKGRAGAGSLHTIPNRCT